MELPPLPAFSDEVVRALGGEMIPLNPAAGEPPCAVLRIGPRCVLLIREKDGRFDLSLPLEGAWRVGTSEEWNAAIPEIQRALAALGPVVSMADAITRMPGGWAVTFGWNPVPVLAWLSRGAVGRVDLEQTAGAVSVTMYEGARTTHQRGFGTLASLDDLAAWADEKAAAQSRVAEAARRANEEEAARRAAMPGPDVGEMLAAIRSGLAFQVGGGRSFDTFGLKDGQPIRTHYDDGYGEDFAVGEDDLRSYMADEPGFFLKILEEWKRR